MSEFREYARYNSGSHILDSGGAYGRWHEKPVIPDDTPLVVWDKRYPEYGPTIETALFLEQWFEPNDEFEHLFKAFCELHPDDDWFTVGQKFMEKIGYTSQARDNTYNGENDLNQMYVWEVWTKEENPDDWLYCSDAVVTIHIHTGCDVRGGYSPPIFCDPAGSSEYCIPVDFCCGYHIEQEGFDYNAPKLPGIGYVAQPFERLSERCSPGYSSWPFGELEDAVGKWLPSDDLPVDQMRAEIDGEVCIVTAYAESWQ